MSIVIEVLIGLLVTAFALGFWIAFAIKPTPWVMWTAIICAAGAAIFWTLVVYVFHHLARM